MGLILDIVNNVVPRVQQRVETGEELKEVLLEELEKEIAHYSTDQSKSYEHVKLINDIIADDEDIDNGEVFDIKSGETIRDL
ncbi:hypothetical protein GNF72_16210 [Clostridium perfringens]|jgi:predicted house-cleaning noncanonical NTP pyrophosphatase (MazG superfamily)|uniref:hypothetical protein n=1 Tax=Clostridium perfringens TaxID=1502 RepID=UPI002AC39766|nr:hypothetical protein [Clostridium perfringens]MDZ5016738.1 hypothetical protein [Clostridium perfringens]